MMSNPPAYLWITNLTLVNNFKSFTKNSKLLDIEMSIVRISGKFSASEIFMPRNIYAEK